VAPPAGALGRSGRPNCSRLPSLAQPKDCGRDRPGRHRRRSSASTAPFKGDKNAKVTLVDFTDYQ